MASEARLWRFAEAGGGTPEGAARAADHLVARGATALLSFGLAGGLDPALRPGDLFVPASLIDEFGATHKPDPALLARLGTARGASLASGTILSSPVAKQAARAASGADAVDCESGAVARAARRHDLPFAILRAICDPASDGLPPAALVPLGAGGRVRIGALLASLATHPTQLPALLRLAAQARLAMAALGRASGILAG